MIEFRWVDEWLAWFVYRDGELVARVPEEYTVLHPDWREEVKKKYGGDNADLQQER
jgi:hypothetical protein